MQGKGSCLQCPDQASHRASSIWFLSEVTSKASTSYTCLAVTNS